MLDRREYVSNEGPHNEPATSTNPENSRALQPYVNRETGVALPLPPEGTDYAELFARLQKLIDNATQTIRELRRENADLNGRVAQLDSYLHQRAQSVGKEEELQKSAARLEELLTLQAALPAPPITETRATSAPPTLLRAFEPTPNVAPVVPAPAPEARREPAPSMTNGYTPTRDTTPFTVPPVLPPAPPPMPVPVMPTYAPPPAPPSEAPRVEGTPPVVSPANAPMAPPPAPSVPPAPIAAPIVHAETPVSVPAAVHVPTLPPTPVVAAAPVTPITPVAATPVAVPPREAVPTLAPVPARRPVPVPVSGNEKVAGTYTLVVYPFTRFSDLGQFQSMLQELVGIHDVQVRRFAQGTLEMRLGYDGSTPLPQALHNLSVGVEDVEEEEPYRLRVRLDLNHAS